MDKSQQHRWTPLRYNVWPRRVIVVLFALLGIASICWRADAHDGGSQQKTINITGIVKEAQTGLPIKNADVRLLQLNSSLLGNISRAGMDAPSTLLGTAVTDSRGRFAFATLSKGPFEITVLHRATRQTGGAQPKRFDRPVIILTSKAPPPVNFKPPP